MNKSKYHLLLFFLALLTLLSLVGFTAVTTKAQEAPVVRVVTKEIPPFVIKEDDRLTGFSIDLWKEIALRANLPFEFIEVTTVNEQLDTLTQGEADVAVAAISMTPERELLLDFSYPYYQAGLQILTKEESRNLLFSLFSVLLSPHLLLIVAMLLLLLIIVGHLVWWLERKNNPDFPPTYRAGVWEGIWWSVVTMTTVGYGDRTVKDIRGRILGIFWMFVGIFLIANFTAVVTSELTVNKLTTTVTGLDDLPGKRIATVANSTSANFLRSRQIKFQATTTIEDAYHLLENDDIDAIVYDAPVLQYYVAAEKKLDYVLVGHPFRSEYYGIALPPNSPYKEAINQALLEIKDDGTFIELAQEWSLSTDEQ